MKIEASNIYTINQYQSNQANAETATSLEPEDIIDISPEALLRSDPTTPVTDPPPPPPDNGG
jgi:hypothetical protein